MEGVIQLAHGDGAKYTQRLIRQVFYKYFNNKLLLDGQDSATFPAMQGKMAFTTDSFVVKPLFFSGGNIGKLAVCGTINDLVVSGAKPLYLSAGFILEEGFPIGKLEEIVKSMAETCMETGVNVIAGDTKVVEKGSVDGLFINTSGIGKVLKGYEIKPIEAGDKIIITGCIGEHGTTIALERYNVNIRGDIKSDCAPLLSFLELLQEDLHCIKIMRDPTRGGLATVLHEFSELSNLGVHIFEEDIPISIGVRASSSLLGLDPFYMACEGRMILVVKEGEAQKILNKIQAVENGENARIIGSFVKGPQDKIFVENYFGGKRILAPLEGNMLPRIC